MIRKISLYWKTWFITTITILATAILFFVILSVFTRSFLNAFQEKNFSQFKSEVLNDLEEKGFGEIKKNSNTISDKAFLELEKSTAHLNKYHMKGMGIYISKNGEMLFPVSNTDFVKYEIDGKGVTAIFSQEKNVEKVVGENYEVIEGDNFIIPLPSEGEAITAQETFTYKGQTYEVLLTYPIIMSDNDLQSVFYTIIPYFIIIGLIVASIASIVYARYFSKKITNLNKIINKMSLREYPLQYMQGEGDELQVLENNLNLMYLELHNTLESLNQEVDVVKKLESDRQLFMRGAVHELKTPIMSMSTSLNTAMELIADEEKEEYMNTLFIKLQSMTKLVNEILEISKLESIRDTGVTHINAALNEVIELYDYMMIDKSIIFNLDSREERDIKIPKRNLMKIISNLIGNAVKYVPENGRIEVEINDTGVMIKNDIGENAIIDKDKIFNPFVSYDKLHEYEFEKGHGLGLYIVSAILTHYEYKYYCDIEDGQFTFKIFF